MVNYHDIHNVLQRAGVMVPAAESHGMLCGMICTEAQPAADRWLNELLSNTEQGNLLVDECRSLLNTVYIETLSQVNDGDLGFHPWLPGEDQPLSVRAQALGEWCQGFVLGLGIGGIDRDTPLPDTSHEILHDFLEIGRAAEYDAGESNDDEHTLSELVEYVRVSVLFIREELQSRSQERYTT